LERNLHAICQFFCSINEKCPNREFYQISQKVIDCGILKIYIPFNGALLLARMIKLFYNTPHVLRRMG
ncbi:hypothetical protein T11_6086, partial [Trichinella zimbabwensis]